MRTGETPDLGGQRGDQDLGGLGIGVAELVELTTLDREGLRSFERDGRRGTVPCRQQGELAEELARSDDAHERDIAHRRGDADRDVARVDGVERLADIAFVEDDLSLRELAAPSVRENGPPFVLVKARQQREFHREIVPRRAAT